MATTLSFNPFNNLGEQIEYGALTNSCGFGQDGSKSSFRCLADKFFAQQEEIKALKQEIAELKKQIPKHRCPQDECLAPWSGADFTYYAAIDDKNEHDLTIWKVPRHLSDIKSANTDYHGAVEQAFADEKFGERHERVDYFIVREMKEADLIKRKIQLKKDEE
jgi:hypothetical protein